MFKKYQHVLMVVLFISCHCAWSASYTTLSSKCDGLPQIPVVTMEGLCVGLVAQKTSAMPFKMPRTLVELDDGKLLLTDMGGWDIKKGKLWLVDYQAPKPSAHLLLSNLDLPHKILKGPDKRIYFSEAQRIRRFSWKDEKIIELETVIDDLPFSENYLHPLKNFTFDKQGNLLINIGSMSDRCDKKSTRAECMSGSEASVRRYQYDAKKNSWNPEFQMLASGLRNSMVLLAHESGTILQAENSMDFPDAEEPYEEINILDEGGFFGWPICYNRTASIDNDKCTAKNYQEPWTLLPPHTAPLDAIYYDHKKLKPLNKKLLMSWHGYRIVGNRMVAFDIDDKGRPLRQKQANFWRAPQAGSGDYTQHAFAPKGELGLVAQHREIISQWNEIPSVRPEGAPVGLTQAKDGSVFIVDDRNAAILRLSTGAAYKAKTEASVTTKIETVNIPEAVNTVFQQRCVQCHSELKKTPEAILNADNWLRKDGNITLIEHKIFWEKTRPMPPDKPLTEFERQVFRDWLKL